MKGQNKTKKKDGNSKKALKEYKQGFAEIKK